MTIAAGAVELFVAARDKLNRKVTLQNISDTETELRIGSTVGVTATQGGVLKGSIDAIATAIIENKAAVYVRNTSASVAKVTGLEEYTA